MFSLQAAYHRHTSLFHIAAIVATGLILTSPAIVFGFPAGGHDTHAHLAWYTHFSSQLWTGDFYPRWLVGMNGGLGSPVFFYYALAPYFVNSVLRPFFANDPYGWHQSGTPWPNYDSATALVASVLGIWSYRPRLKRVLPYQ